MIMAGRMDGWMMGGLLAGMVVVDSPYGRHRAIINNEWHCMGFMVNDHIGQMCQSNSSKGEYYVGPGLRKEGGK